MFLLKHFHIHLIFKEECTWVCTEFTTAIGIHTLLSYFIFDGNRKTQRKVLWLEINLKSDSPLYHSGLQFTTNAGVNMSNSVSIMSSFKQSKEMSNCNTKHNIYTHRKLSAVLVALSSQRSKVSGMERPEYLVNTLMP